MRKKLKIILDMGINLIVKGCKNEGRELVHFIFKYAGYEYTIAESLVSDLKNGSEVTISFDKSIQAESFIKEAEQYVEKIE
jgi:hypothetical protein